MVVLHSLGSSGCIIDNQVVNPVVEESLQGRQNSLIYGMEARAGIEPALRQAVVWGRPRMSETLDLQGKTRV